MNARAIKKWRKYFKMMRKHIASYAHQIAEAKRKEAYNSSKLKGIIECCERECRRDVVRQQYVVNELRKDNNFNPF